MKFSIDITARIYAHDHVQCVRLYNSLLHRQQAEIMAVSYPEGTVEHVASFKHWIAYSLGFRNFKSYNRWY